ncbi:MAG: DUF59 domain-containing protein, partial [Anaerolineales bacterium]|nr:DUF59 domain-containing protein [Anaerolineales bacterium]
MTEENTVPQTLWEVDSTHPELAEQIRDALREVVDPELGLNVVELGLIRDASVSKENLHLRMILTTPF